MRVHMYTLGGNGSPQRAGLLTRIVVGLVSAAVLVASAFLGLFIFLMALGLLAVAVLYITVRYWLFKYSLRQNARHDTHTHARDRSQGRTEPGQDYIDVEFDEK